MEQLLGQFTNAFKEELDLINAEYTSFKFNTSQLPDAFEYTYPNKDIRTHSCFKDLFESTEKIKAKCLYWFSVKTIEEGNILKQLISENRSRLWSEDKTKCRILPAGNNNQDSTIIYVGVRKGSAAKTQKITNISGRFVQHLGYYKEGRTQGLQLAYFARNLNIEITLHIHSLYNCPDEYLYILEKLFARKLRPICGKH